MSSADGHGPDRLHGEVYNFRSLRSELGAAGHRFETSSDTEVVIEAYAESGADCFTRFNGLLGVAFLEPPGLTHAAPRVSTRPLGASNQ